MGVGLVGVSLAGIVRMLRADLGLGLGLLFGALARPLLRLKPATPSWLMPELMALLILSFSRIYGYRARSDFGRAHSQRTGYRGSVQSHAVALGRIE